MVWYSVDLICFTRFFLLHWTTNFVHWISRLLHCITCFRHWISRFPHWIAEMWHFITHTQNHEFDVFKQLLYNICYW